MAGSYACLSFFVLTPLLFWYVGRKGSVSAKDLYSVVVAPLLAAVSVLVGLALLRLAHWLPEGGVGILVALAAVPILSGATLLVLPSGRDALRDVLRVVRLVAQ